MTDVTGLSVRLCPVIVWSQLQLHKMCKNIVTDEKLVMTGLRPNHGLKYIHEEHGVTISDHISPWVIQIHPEMSEI